jgi:hypothetical protein
MRLETLIPQLEGAAGLAGRVEVCPRAADALAQNKSGPWCWLTEFRGQSGENRLLNQCVRQRREQRFSTLTLVSDAGDASGAGALAKSADLREAIMAQLLGFDLGAGFDPVAHLRDAIIGRRDGKLYWLDEWVTYHHIRSTQ